MTINKRDWPKNTWNFPLTHTWNFAFGLGMDNLDVLKASTIMPLLMQDNALVDYETIKVNPENADFVTRSDPNTHAGSYVPKVVVSWIGFSASTEVDVMKFMTMNIHTAMLNRLDAFDKATGSDVETILELTHETTDEQAYPLWNGTKLYEGHHTEDLPVAVPGLTANQQPEGVAFDIATYYNSRKFYTNAGMIRQVTDRMKTHYINGDISANIRTSDKMVSSYEVIREPMIKFQHPYTFLGKLFHVPLAGTIRQLQVGGSVTQIEHLTVLGRVGFVEYNPDFNFSRA